jgi:hypothetical protein
VWSRTQQPQKLCMCVYVFGPQVIGVEASSGLQTCQTTLRQLLQRVLTQLYDRRVRAYHCLID